MPHTISRNVSAGAFSIARKIGRQRPYSARDPVTTASVRFSAKVLPLDRRAAGEPDLRLVVLSVRPDIEPELVHREASYALTVCQQLVDQLRHVEADPGANAIEHGRRDDIDAGADIERNLRLFAQRNDLAVLDLSDAVRNREALALERERDHVALAAMKLEHVAQRHLGQQIGIDKKKRFRGPVRQQTERTAGSKRLAFD